MILDLLDDLDRGKGVPLQELHRHYVEDREHSTYQFIGELRNLLETGEIYQPRDGVFRKT